MATQDDYIRTALRVPPDLHAKIHESAKENNRTFNAEIVARLEQTFSGTSSDEALKALALRLAETELALAVADVESESRLLDVFVASSCAVEAAAFNKHMGYECPLDPDALHEVETLLNESSVALDEKNKDDFLQALEEMKEANERVKALREKSSSPKRPLSQRARLKKNLPSDH